SQLGKTQKELRQIIQEREKKIQEIHHSVNLSKKNTEKEKSDSVEVFTSLIRSIERSQAELLQVMEEKQKAAETQAEGLIKELQQEITDLKTRYTELEQLSHTDDHLHFLQSYISMCCAPDTRIRTEIRINIEVNVAFLRMTLSKFQQTLNEKLEETVSRELKRNKQYAVDVSLDPDTAHPNIILSDDGKHVTYADTKQNLSGMQKRFTNYPMILGKHGFSSGRFYYEVQVSGKTMWDLGVVRESVKNKGRFKAFKPHNGYWTLILRKGNEYNARDESLIPLFLSKKPQKIGVFVDYEEGLVSFYDVETSSHIYSFTVDVTLDPDAAHPNIVLSDDGKQFTCGIAAVVNGEDIMQSSEHFFPCTESCRFMAFVSELKSFGVQTLVRVCEATYDKAPVEKEGIEVLDWPFDDGCSPSDQIVDDWLNLLKCKFKDEPGCCIAVHCVAGLGRAPVLVAIALIECGMMYEDAVQFIRQKRRGAFNSKQLMYLEKYKPKMRLRFKDANGYGLLA
ncbi:E3 ubiquitin-protein ligase TRIM39-like, partial [Clarias magur]